MKQPRRAAPVVILLALAIAGSILAPNPPPLAARGAFRPAPPPPRRRIDAERYRRGRTLFLRPAALLRRRPATRKRGRRNAIPAGDDTHRVVLDTVGGDGAAARVAEETFEQGLRLMEIEGQLSDAERKEHRLTELAGKLTPAQLDALRYYVSTRALVPGGFSARRFLLGERVFHRRIELPSVDPARVEVESKRLREIEEAIASPGERGDLAELAGRLGPEHLDALERYVKTRGAVPESFDAERFALGEQVFLGEAPTGTAGSAEFVLRQRRALAHLQRLLPLRVQRRRDLTRLAGTLDDAQLGDLVYFLGVRFRILTGSRGNRSQSGVSR